MFPAAVLFSLAELLIPELARCAAAERPGRIHHLVRKSLGIGLMYGLVCGCVMILLGQELGLRLYNSQDAGIWLKRYALLAPMLYCDAIVDAMNKGLGQQVYSVRYNILTSGLDILFLYILLPVYGMQGYFWSFLVTHVINFVLSLRRLLLASGVKIQPYRAMFALVSALTSLLFALQTGPKLGQIVVFFITFGCLAHLFGVLKMADWRWLKALIRPRKANTAP
jgi:stage V sporulation protein B